MKNSITHSSLKVSSFSDDALTFVVCLKLYHRGLSSVDTAISAYNSILIRLNETSTTFSNLPFLKQAFRRIQAEEDKNLEHFN